MRAQSESRRYLARIDTRALGHLYTDCLVIGGGVAGLRAALEAAKAAPVILMTKGDLLDSNSYKAQGGIAAVLRDEDSFESHIADTLTTGCGLCDEQVVDQVVRGGPKQIEELLAWGTPFDKENGDRLAAGREGGHSHNRIVHAMGDATGKAIVLSLRGQVKGHEKIKIFEQCFSIDLLTKDGVCYGVFCYHPKHGYQCVWARRTILASGGAGQLYRETTNPAGATADGLAMAYRAGAVLSDLEFMQFHPTTLYIAGAARTLVTEALRGAGAKLVDRKGNRFMNDYHEMGELAPRDLVSRASYWQMQKTNSTHVYLDVRHLGSAFLKEHFPTISALCDEFDIHVDNEMIPVRPSAHYMVGGVKTDLEGRTNIQNLYCCGEVSATGLHGSNRLASNSLLEGLVYGEICGRGAAEAIRKDNGEVGHRTIRYEIVDSPRTRLDLADVTNSLRAVMWRNVGVERVGDRLGETIEIIDFWGRYVLDKVFDDIGGWQCQNMLTVSRLMTQSALKRQESRGVHYRSDYPEKNDAMFKCHFDVGPVVFEGE